MNSYYLKTSNACNLASLAIGVIFEGDNKQIENYITFEGNQKERFSNLIDDIKSCLMSYWDIHKIETFKPGNYWYLTTGRSSHIKNLRIIEEATYIGSVQDAEATSRFNYFSDRKDAEKLLSMVKSIFKTYSIYF